MGNVTSNVLELDLYKRLKVRMSGSVLHRFLWLICSLQVPQLYGGTIIKFQNTPSVQKSTNGNYLWIMERNVQILIFSNSKFQCCEHHKLDFIHFWHADMEADISQAGKITSFVPQGPSENVHFLAIWVNWPSTICTEVECVDCLDTDLVGHLRRWWKRTAGPGLWRSCLPLRWCRWWEQWVQWPCTLKWHLASSGWLWCLCGCTPPMIYGSLRRDRDELTETNRESTQEKKNWQQFYYNTNSAHMLWGKLTKILN